MSSKTGFLLLRPPSELEDAGNHRWSLPRSCCLSFSGRMTCAEAWGRLGSCLQACSQEGVANGPGAQSCSRRGFPGCAWSQGGVCTGVHVRLPSAPWLGSRKAAVTTLRSPSADCGFSGSRRVLDRTGGTSQGPGLRWWRCPHGHPAGPRMATWATAATGQPPSFWLTPGRGGGCSHEYPPWNCHCAGHTVHTGPEELLGRE